MKKLLERMSVSVTLLASYAMQKMAVSAWIVNATGFTACGAVAPFIGVVTIGILAGQLAAVCAEKIYGSQGETIFYDDDAGYNHVTAKVRATALGCIVGAGALLLMPFWSALACGLSAICIEQVLQGKWRTLSHVITAGLLTAGLLGMGGGILRLGLTIASRLPAVMTARNTALTAGAVLVAPMLRETYDYLRASGGAEGDFPPPDTYSPPDTCVP